VRVTGGFYPYDTDTSRKHHNAHQEVFMSKRREVQPGFQAGGKDMGRLDGKVTLITGAAGGIGAAAARRFVAEGARVVLVDRDEEGLAAVVKALEPRRVQAAWADLTDETAIVGVVETAVQRFGTLDVAVLNAGITGTREPLEDYPTELFDEVLGVNLRGTWLALRAVVPVMKAAGAGSIVLTSSIQGLAALGGTTAYTTSKHAVIGMMRGAAVELAPSGIRVNAIVPGFTDTPMMDRIHRDASPDDPDAVHAALAAPVPMGRYARADEIAALLLFLASDESSYSTGACFVADGGLLARLAG
jgi:NAD(P)-dependent dehydrogenase (short-subunit alcohol dehydrogenase family)